LFQSPESTKLLRFTALCWVCREAGSLLGATIFGCGQVILACFDPQADGDSWEAKPNPDHLYFSVDDLEEYFRRVGAQPNGRILRPIETQPWGERSFYCADPFGKQTLLRRSQDGIYRWLDMSTQTPPNHRLEQRKGMTLTPSADGILDELRGLCLSLPETSERASWGHPNFLAGQKTFVTFERFHGRPSIAFRLGRSDIDRFSRNSQFFQTPYGRGQWLSLWVDTCFDWNVVKKLVIKSYTLVALKRMLVALEART
jgi:predicted DNA-binding protein (MmcQ/YjbR family)